MHTWETVHEHGTNRTERMTVPGGWLYRARWGSSVVMTFVPYDHAQTVAADEGEPPPLTPLARDYAGRFLARADEDADEDEEPTDGEG